MKKQQKPCHVRLPMRFKIIGNTFNDGGVFQMKWIVKKGGLC